MEAAIRIAAKRLSTEVSRGVGWKKISSRRKRAAVVTTHPIEKAFISTGRSETTFPDSPFTTA